MSTYTNLVKPLKEQNKIRFLDLRDQCLTEILAEVFQLTNLKKLSLSYSQIEVIPPEIGQIANLVEPDIRSNQIDLTLYQIGNIKTLTRLELGRNHLVTVPPEIGQLTNLIGLNF